jgi:hypothetical protein
MWARCYLYGGLRAMRDNTVTSVWLAFMNTALSASCEIERAANAQRTGIDLVRQARPNGLRHSAQ